MLKKKNSNVYAVLHTTYYRPTFQFNYEQQYIIVYQYNVTAISLYVVSRRGMHPRPSPGFRSNARNAFFLLTERKHKIIIKNKYVSVERHVVDTRHHFKFNR